MAEENRLAEKPRDTWFDEWIAFFKVLRNPFVLISLAVAIGLVRFQWRVQSLPDADPWVLAVLTLLTSIIAGVAASLVTRRWIVITEQGVAVVRGKSAIGGLTLLLSNIALLKNRVGEYIKRLPEEDYDPELIKTYLEETKVRCSSLQLEVINSIEEWIDLIPQAEVRPKIAMISDLQAEVGEKSQYIAQLEQDLAKVKGESEEDKARIDQLQEEMRKARAESAEALKALTRTKSTVDRGVLRGIGDVPTTYPSTASEISTPRSWRDILYLEGVSPSPCSQCGGPRTLSDISYDDGLCGDCRDKSMFTRQ